MRRTLTLAHDPLKHEPTRGTAPAHDPLEHEPTRGTAKPADGLFLRESAQKLGVDSAA